MRARRLGATIVLAACFLGPRTARAAESPIAPDDAMADSTVAASGVTGGDSLGTPDRAWADRSAYPVAEGDSVRWRPLPPMGRVPARILIPTGAGSLPLWQVPVRDTLMDAFALHRLLHQRLDIGFVAEAESCAWVLARLPNVWQTEGINLAADLALARGDTARALAALGAAARQGADPLDTAARAMRRAALLLARGDTAEARRSCWSIVRRWPALAPAREAVATLDRLAAGSDSLDAGNQRAAAEVEVLAGDRGAAIRRLQRVFPGRAGARGWEIGLRLAELQRMARQFTDALATLAITAGLGADRAEPRLSLERARVHRDAGRADSAYASYAIAAGVKPGSEGAETALWETGREAEERGEWDRARLVYAGAELLGGSRAPQAALRLGLVWMVAGNRPRARACFARATGEAARFWWAVAARDSDAASADSAWIEIARRPGYTFYRACARESLGVRGWPGGVRLALPGPGSPGMPGTMRWLIETGMKDDAARVGERWAADDPAAGVPAAGVRSRPDQMAEVARLTFAIGRPRPAIRLAARAFEIVAAQADSATGPDSAWSYVPAIYPPLYDSLFARVARDPRIRVEPALLRALVWKESHFDSAAASRSGALGLTQLLAPAAADMARALHLAAPDSSALLSPETNLLLGARYLRWLLDRLGGSVPLALAGYNAGPSLARRWGAAVGAGGEALLCELFAYAETQDYVKTVLAVRQAYRELRPRVEPD